MATLFESIKTGVTAEEAARAYGLEFGRNRRARCPWHEDTHPDLAFYEQGTRCYCHACHQGGDVIALTAQLFSLTPLEAARKLNEDFRLNARAGKPSPAAAPARLQREKALRRWRDQRFSYACAAEKDARSHLEATRGGWDNPDFRLALRAMAYSQDECELLHALKNDELSAWSEVPR